MSLDEPLLDFLTQYQEEHQMRSKSEVVAQALTLLRSQNLEAQYESALQEWEDAGEAALWEVVISDGLSEDGDATR